MFTQRQIDALAAIHSANRAVAQAYEANKKEELNTARQTQQTAVINTHRAFSEQRRSTDSI